MSCLENCPVAASLPLRLLAEFGGDVLGHSLDLPMRCRELVLRYAPPLHPELDSLAFGHIKLVFIDEATLVLEAGNGESC